MFRISDNIINFNKSYWKLVWIQVAILFPSYGILFIKSTSYQYKARFNNASNMSLFIYVLVITVWQISYCYWLFLISHFVYTVGLGSVVWFRSRSVEPAWHDRWVSPVVASLTYIIEPQEAVPGSNPPQTRKVHRIAPQVPLFRGMPTGSEDFQMCP